MAATLIAKRFYVYNVSSSALAAAGTDTQSFTVAQDSDFYLLKMTYSADIAAAAQTDSTRVVPLVTVQITETSSGNSMFDTAVPIPSIFGDGRIPFILPAPKQFKANSNVSINFANYSAATAYNLHLSFIGYRAYYG